MKNIQIPASGIRDPASYCLSKIQHSRIKIRLLSNYDNVHTVWSVNDGVARCPDFLLIECRDAVRFSNPGGQAVMWWL